MSEYAEFDDKLLTLIASGMSVFSLLNVKLENDAKVFCNEKSPLLFRIVDRRLQILRRQGKISYSSKTGWTIHRKEVADNSNIDYSVAAMKAAFEAKYARDWNDPAGDDMKDIWMDAWNAASRNSVSALTARAKELRNFPLNGLIGDWNKRERQANGFDLCASYLDSIKFSENAAHSTNAPWPESSNSKK